MEVILYSTGCPKCRILAKVLDMKKIPYKTETNTAVMINKRIESIPALETDGKMMGYDEAYKWLAGQPTD